MKKNSDVLDIVRQVLISVLCSMICFVTVFYFYNKLGTKNIVVNEQTVSVHSSLSTKELSNVIQSIIPCVVDIQCQISSSTKSLGSGVVYSRLSNTNTYYIITNYHVVENAQSIVVKLSDKTSSFSASLIGADVDNDIAIISVTVSESIAESVIKPAAIGISSDLLVGQTAIVIGNSMGQLSGTVTTGIISGLDRNIKVDDTQMTLIQTNAQINSGNSGGGLFNELGQLVGIVNAKSSGTGIEGIGFAIPIDTAKVSANKLLTTFTDTTKGYIEGQVKLAKSYLIINEQNFAQYQTSVKYNNYGVYIDSIYADNDLDNAGLKNADCIKMINLVTITSTDDISRILSGLSIGDTVLIIITRYVINLFQTLSYTFTLTQFICQI